MTMIRRHACAAMLLPLLALACNEAPRSSTITATERDDAARTMAGIDADVRLDVALKRIAVLEREVAELKAGPAAVDADMLRQQLSATQNALAEASRDSIGNGETSARSPDDITSQMTPKAVPQRTGRPAEQTSAPSRPNKTTAAQSKQQVTDRPGLDLDLR